MVQLFSCHCLNVSIHLEEPPTRSSDLSSIESALPSPTSLGRSILGVGGVLQVLSQLVSTQTISVENKEYTLHQCHNCGILVYLSRENQILVNTDLLTDEQAEELRTSPSYSSIYNLLIVKDNDLNIPIEENIPSSDVIENLLKETLNIKKKEMEDRIRQVEREEREKFNQLERTGITQAQILLKKLWLLHSQDASNPSSASSSSSVTPMYTPPNTPANDAKIPKEGEGSSRTDPVQEAPLKVVKPAVTAGPGKVDQPKSLTQSLGVFDFDDEFGEQKEQSVDENDEQDELANYEQEKKRAPSARPAMVVPASLPLPIPKQMQSRASHTTPTEEEFVEPPHIYSRTIQASTYIDYDARPTRKKINLI